MALLESVGQLLNYLPGVSSAIPKKTCKSRVDNCSFVPESVHMSSIVRVAGLSGAVAVALGAYGSHVLRDDPSISDNRKKAFDTASRYHLIHTLALLAAPRARYPLVTGVTILGGLVLFCGPCYYYSLTGNESTRRLTPIGGVLFILGWLTFIL